jgi:tagatose-1,6-bisphosphate aldolase non-catalytic subunit AgaZ/GatZ
MGMRIGGSITQWRLSGIVIADRVMALVVVDGVGGHDEGIAGYGDEKKKKKTAMMMMMMMQFFEAC